MPEVPAFFTESLSQPVLAVGGPGSFPDFVDKIAHVSPEVYVGYFLAFLIGVVFVLLIPKAKVTEETKPNKGDAKGDLSTGEMRARDLVWRHEKLILTEQQLAEKQKRLQDLVSQMGEHPEEHDAYAAAALFLVNEAIREERHLTGSEISREDLIAERLADFEEKLFNGNGVEEKKWRKDAAALREEAGVLQSKLTERQGQLRNAFQVMDRAETLLLGGIPIGGGPAEVRSRLFQARALVERLPEGLHHEVEENERKVKELLASPPSEAKSDVTKKLKRFADVIAVDGFSATEREQGKAGLLSAIDRAIAAVDSPNGSSKPSPFLGVPEEKDTFRAPVFFDDTAQRELAEIQPGENVFQDDKLDFPVESEEGEEKDGSEENGLPRDFSQVIFCGNDPSLWNKNVYRAARERARSIEDLPEGIHWLSMKRLDTGERVFCPVTNEELLDGGDGFSSGFNGSNEVFYDAHHLGLFSEECDGEVETRFTYGGWGFGHQVGGFDDVVDTTQSFGWDGKRIPDDTVFEISVYAVLPKTGEKDVVLRKADQLVS